MTEIVMAEIITKDELTLISLPPTGDAQAIWNVFNKLCDNRTKVRIIYSKEDYGTKETVMLWPASPDVLRTALDSTGDITSDICQGSDDFKLSSIPLLSFGNVFWCSKDLQKNLSLFSLVKLKRTSQSAIGFEVRFRKKRYMIGLLNR